MSTTKQTPKFGGSNFPEWMSGMEELLKEKKAWRYVSGREIMPVEEDYAEKEKRIFKKDKGTWFTEDEAAVGLIGSGLKEWLKKEVKDIPTSKAQWDYLVNKYKPAENLLSTVDDFGSIFRSKFTGGSMDELITHFNTFMNLNGRLGSLALPDAALALTMIESLPTGEPWGTIRQGALNAVGNPRDLKSQAVWDHYVLRLKFDQTESQPTSTVLAAVGSNSSTASSSRQRPRKAIAAKVPCDYCSRTHPIGVCWKQSHDQLQASQNRPNVAALTQAVAMTAISPPLTRNPAPSEPYEVFCGLITQSLAAALTHAFPKSSSFKEAIHVDSGCNVHISCMRSYFNDESFEQLTTPIPIKVGNGAVAHATHRGTISFLTFRQDLPSAELRLSNVLFCSELSTTLLSPQQLYRFKMKTILGGPESHIAHSDTNRVVALCPLSPVTNLYQLSATPLGSRIIASLTASVRTIDINLLHRTMGHLNYDDCRRMVAKRLVADIDALTGRQLEFCVDCVVSKHARFPFPTSESTVKTKLALVHSDLAGPFPPSLTHSRYIMTLVDHCTDYCWVFFLKTKGEAFEKFKQWQARVELESGERVVKLRTDGGGEYTSKEFEKYLVDLGINHQTTNPETPQQNGKAEHKNRTLLCTGRASLSESKLSNRFWTEAFNNSNDVINRRPHKKQKNRTPYEAWHGSKPLVSHFKPFGCPAYALDHHSSNKVAPRSRFCHFLGVGDSTKGYRLWCPQERRVLFSREVVLDVKSIMPIGISQLPECDVSEVTDVIDRHLTELPQSTDAVQPDSSEVCPTTEEDDEQPDPGPEPMPDRLPSPFSSPLTSLAPTPRESPAPPEPPFAHRQNEADRLFDFFEHHPLVEDNAALQANVEEPVANLVEWEQGLREEKDIDYLDVDFEDMGIGICLASISGPEEPPKTIRQVFMRPEKERESWLDAIYSEIDSLMERGVIKVIDEVPAGKRLLNSSLVLKVKRNLEGAVERYKARLVADGRRQTEGIDYKETFAPVVKMTSVRILTALAVQHNLVIEHLDVETAFLYGDLEEELYMKPPAGWEKLDPKGRKLGELWLLLKSLYGVKQASEIWNRLLNEVLLDFGLQRLHSDYCIYFYQEKEKKLILAVYVDDMANAHNCATLSARLKTHLSKHFRIKDLGRVAKFLGIEVIHHPTTHSIELSQRHYIRELIVKFQPPSGFAPTPVSGGVLFTSKDSPQSLEEKNSMQNVPYRELVGSLMYISTGTRPDIAFAVSNLSRFLSNPGKHHWIQALRVLQYLRDSEDLVICYSANSSGDGDLLTGYTDSDWAGDVDRRRSTSGYIFTMCGGPISWKSRLQPIVATSSTEAEYVATVPACQDAIWLRRLLNELGIPQKSPTLLRMDNLGALAISKHPKAHQRTRHIDLRFHYIRECIKDEHIRTEWVPTDENLADTFTKALTPEIFSRLLKMMGMTRRSV